MRPSRLRQAAWQLGDTRRASRRSSCRACRSTSRTTGATQVNFTATDNLDVAPTDFEPYCVTAPRDARLPDGGGQRDLRSLRHRADEVRRRHEQHRQVRRRSRRQAGRGVRRCRRHLQRAAGRRCVPERRRRDRRTRASISATRSSTTRRPSSGSRPAPPSRRQVPVDYSIRHELADAGQGERLLHAAMAGHSDWRRAPESARASRCSRSGTSSQADARRRWAGRCRAAPTRRAWCRSSSRAPSSPPRRTQIDLRLSKIVQAGGNQAAAG